MPVAQALPNSCPSYTLPFVTPRKGRVEPELNHYPQKCNPCGKECMEIVEMLLWKTHSGALLAYLGYFSSLKPLKMALLFRTDFKSRAFVPLYSTRVCRI
jgi:hypothetical protein